jgi:hypothetical protein
MAGEAIVTILPTRTTLPVCDGGTLEAGVDGAAVFAGGDGAMVGLALLGPQAVTRATAASAASFRGCRGIPEPFMPSTAAQGPDLFDLQAVIGPAPLRRRPYQP